jgi:hypothetical protein
MDVTAIQTDSVKMTAGPGATKDSFDICQICYDKWIEHCKKYLGDIKKGSIKCDMCPTYMSGKFEYFRAIFAKVVVSAGSEKGKFDTELVHQHMDYNVCSKCYSAIRSTINKTMKEKAVDEWS